MHQHAGAATTSFHWVSHKITEVLEPRSLRSRGAGSRAGFFLGLLVDGELSPPSGLSSLSVTVPIPGFQRQSRSEERVVRVLTYQIERRDTIKVFNKIYFKKIKYE